MAYMCVRGNKECDGCGRCQENDVFCACDWCGKAIYLGDSYYKIYNNFVCDDCIFECLEYAEKD